MAGSTLSNYEEITEAGVALVREFLNRKGCIETMKMLDMEMPRTEHSITNRAQLVQTLHIATLMRKNKEQQNSYRTMIEVLAWERIRKKYKGCASSDTDSPTREKANTQNITVQTSYLQLEETSSHDNRTTTIDHQHSNDQRISREMRPKTAYRVRPTTAGSRSRQENHSSSDISVSPVKRPSTSHVKQRTPEPLKNKNNLVEQEDVLLDLDADTDFTNPEFNWMKKEKEVQKLNKIKPKVRKSTKSKKNEQPNLDGGITLEIATNLKSVIFGPSTSRSFNDAWTNQSFAFHECKDGRGKSLRCGIVQKQGGPCGLLAVVQSYFMKHLLFESSNEAPPNVLDVSDSLRSHALAMALAEIIWRCGNASSAIVAIMSPRQQYQSFSSGTNDGITEFVTFTTCQSMKQLQQLLLENITSFEHGRGACIMLLYSVLMTRGIDIVRGDMDEQTSTLIGSHFYCTQELVNLLISGRACSNVFNGVMTLDKDKQLMGIEEQCDVGFLTLFEHYDSCKVGEHLKTPKYPIWIVCSESHYSVFFALNRNPLHYGSPSFDLYYYDGLANQDEEIRLTVTCGAGLGVHEEEFVPPLEHCIRTRWTGAKIDWNGTEPLL